MPILPAELLPLIVEFAPLFSKPVWEHVKALLVGALLATCPYQKFHHPFNTYT